MKSSSSLRGVALLELIKGIAVLVAGFGLLAFVHEGAQATLNKLIMHFHLNPASHYPGIFLDLFSARGEHKLQMLAACAIVYVLVRFAEAYGLYNDQVWAKWLGFVGAAVYIPIELYEIFTGFQLLTIGVFLINVLVLLIIGRSLFKKQIDELIEVIENE